MATDSDSPVGVLMLRSESQASLGFGLNLGGMAPDSDETARSTWGQDFSYNGTVSWLTKSGFEFRGLLGFYGTTSRHPDDVGTNFRMDLTQLAASMLYKSPFYEEKGRAYSRIQKPIVLTSR